MENEESAAAPVDAKRRRNRSRSFGRGGRRKSNDAKGGREGNIPLDLLPARPGRERRTVKQEDFAAVIDRLMRTYQLQCRDIKEKDRFQLMHGLGNFECEGLLRNNCKGYQWASYYSWAELDLREQTISYRWRMKCQHCLCPCDPTFDLRQAEKMVEIAICRYKGMDYPEKYKRRGYYFFNKDPHLSRLCEKCGYGTTCCWINVRR